MAAPPASGTTEARRAAAGEQVEYAGLYSIAGDGVVCGLRIDGRLSYFDRRGLQHRIIERQRDGDSTQAEEAALREINSVLEFGLHLAH